MFLHFRIVCSKVNAGCITVHVMLIQIRQMVVRTPGYTFGICLRYASLLNC